MSEEDIERFEDDLELRLWQEYRDVLPMFTYAVETERRFYLANHVHLTKHEGPGGPWFEVELTDAWVWDMYRPARFVSRVQVVSIHDVNIEDLAHREAGPGDPLGTGVEPGLGEESGPDSP
ncbi:MAG TPA: DUF2469 family protein [Actinomycetota bacterium]